MASIRNALIVQRFVEFELLLCCTINQKFRIRTLQKFFSVVSRLGDGVFWYSLILLLPLWFGLTAIHTSMLMVLCGVVNLLIYKAIKSFTCRQRPCNLDPNIVPGARLLDHYSFPSGHTLHAVGFSILAIASFPVLTWLLLPFSLLVACSRVVLGLHYPTDVFAGAILGALVATFGLQFLPNLMALGV